MKNNEGAGSQQRQSKVLIATLNASQKAQNVFKEFIWPHLADGDGELRNGILHIEPDGAHRWTAEVRSTDAGDIWWCNWEMLNQDGRVVVEIPVESDKVGQTISVADRWTSFSREWNWQSAKAAVAPHYSEIVIARLHYSC